MMCGSKLVLLAALLPIAGCSKSEPPADESTAIMREEDHEHYHVHGVDVSHEHTHEDEQHTAHEHGHSHDVENLSNREEQQSPEQ